MDIEAILRAATSDISETTDLKALEALRIRFLGKKGIITQKLKELGTHTLSERPAAGTQINRLKRHLTELLQAKKAALEQASQQASIRASMLDVTLPGRRPNALGSLHPMTHTMRRLEAIFASLGFRVAHGPEIEDPFHNFTALNIPKHHPARAMHDTFYLKGGKKLLRTHTSPVQIREMLKHGAPIQIIAPGRVYRCDSDQTHTPMFHQLEGLMVDKGVHFGHLKGLLKRCLSAFFERDIHIRLRPSFFPFTEPSAEVDMACVSCSSAGCRVCSQTGWLEILGCGMVHPNVLRHGGIDPDSYTGFAFGVGIDRLAMLRYKIDDLRVLFENDLEFLEQF